MAVATTSVVIDDMRLGAMHVLRMTGAYADLSAGDSAKVDQCTLVAQRYIETPSPVEIPGMGWVVGHRWSWATPIAQIVVWPLQEPTSGMTITTNGSTSVTSSGSTWYSPSMIGKTLTAYTNDDAETLVGTVGTVASISGSTVTLAASTSVSNGTYRWGMVADGSYRLPDDFGGMEGAFLTYTGNARESRVPIVGETQVREALQSSPSVGRPRWAATRPSGAAGASYQRWELVVYPVPEAVYTLDVPYVFTPDKLSNSLTYPGGGALFGELWRAAAMAAAEAEFLEDGSSTYRDRFRDRMAAAIAADLRLHTPRRIAPLRNTVDLNGDEAIMSRIWSRSTPNSFVP